MVIIIHYDVNMAPESQQGYSEIDSVESELKPSDGLRILGELIAMRILKASRARTGSGIGVSGPQPHQSSSHSPRANDCE
jgi:hypothetical protein